jgi:mannose-6-phosphate isomerase-like protein (cupin superfamily)
MKYKINISTKEALDILKNTRREFVEVYKYNSMSLEIYKPVGEDKQSPHDRDEAYIVISGEGKFQCAGEYVNFKPGDFLFVPSGIEHRFEKFTDDFITWVIFFGESKSSLL